MNWSSLIVQIATGTNKEKVTPCKKQVALKREAVSYLFYSYNSATPRML